MNQGDEAGSTTPQMDLTEEAPRGRGETLAKLLLLASCSLALMFAVDIFLLLATGSGAERRDFVSYWASGQQLAHHQNPYDADAILRLERSVGYPAGNQALIVRNPPWALPLVAPLGSVSFRMATVMWSLLLICCWALSLRLLWPIEAQPRHIDLFGYPISAGLICALFAPALACIFFGQTALFALLGLALFLRFCTSRPVLAGASLWLCALKPHLFLVFGVVLVLWIARTRSYRVLAGAVAAAGASLAIAYAADPAAWRQYGQMMRTAGMDREFIPCFGIALRFAIHSGWMWLQYVPAIAGCVWAVRHYWTRRTTWDWNRNGPLLALVSMVLSPYAWLTDQALAAPAVLRAAFRGGLDQLVALAAMGAAIEIAILCRIYMHSAFYLWTAPAWLVWYLIAARYNFGPRSASQ